MKPELEAAIQKIKHGGAFNMAFQFFGTREEVDALERAIDEVPPERRPEYRTDETVGGEWWFYITRESPSAICSLHGHDFGNFYIRGDGKIIGTCERCWIKQAFDELPKPRWITHP